MNTKSETTQVETSPVHQTNKNFSAEISQQLYRYAEDLQHLIERNEKMKAHYESLLALSDQLAQSREELENLMRRSQDIHLVTNRDGRILQANPAVEILAAKNKIINSYLSDWVLPSHQNLVTTVHRSGQLDEIELHLRHPNSNIGVLIVAVQIVQAGSDFHWVMRDITQLRKREFDSQISSVILKNATEGVMITNAEGQIRAINPAFTRITGYSAEEAIGQNPRILQSGLQSDHFYQAFWASLKETDNWQGIIHNRTKDGQMYPQWLTVTGVRNEANQLLSYIAVLSDLSELQKAENDLTYLAYYDTLTKLPNRLLLHERIRQILSQARRSGAPFTVIFIDLDLFKKINDLHGHEIGDYVLKVAAQRMSVAVREIDTVARLGGDEFVILAPGLCGEADIARLCDKIIATLRHPIELDGLKLTIGGSLGCAEYPRHGEDEIVLIKHADKSMYQAKKAGGNTFCIYQQQAQAAHKEAGNA